MIDPIKDIAYAAVIKKIFSALFMGVIKGKLGKQVNLTLTIIKPPK